jgi:hypothetical protein
MEQAGNRSRRVSTAAESKQKNSVSIAVHVHQVTVTVRHIVEQPGAEREALHHRPRLFNAAACIRRPDCSHARVVVPKLVAVDDQRLIKLHDIRVGIRIVKVVARSVAAQDNVSRHS